MVSRSTVARRPSVLQGSCRPGVNPCTRIRPVYVQHLTVSVDFRPVPLLTTRDYSFRSTPTWVLEMGVSCTRRTSGVPTSLGQVEGVGPTWVDHR